MFETLTSAVKAQKYIRAIRNPQKRHYANVYLDYRLGILHEEPTFDGLSYMAAQAVRMNIDSYIG